MGNIKKVIALFLALLMTVALIACTPRKTESDNGPGVSNNTESDKPEKASEIKVVDMLGREVILDRPATKVVGIHNPTLNAAVVLGGGQKYLAGFGPKGMGRGLYTAVMDDFEGLPQIGAAGKINLEAATAAGAELAIVPERLKEQIEEFESIGLPSIVIIPGRESIVAVKDTLTMLGKAIGEDNRANEINKFFDKKIADAKTISSAEAKPKQKVLFLGGDSPLSVAPSAMIQTELIEAAGGENAVSGIDSEGDFADVSIEQIITWNPDVIWFPAYANYTVKNLINDPAWGSINAVKNKKVYRFPSALEPWDQPTAAVALGVSWATHNLYPDSYSLDELKKDTDEFYNLIYGKTFTLEQMGLK